MNTTIRPDRDDAPPNHPRKRIYAGLSPVCANHCGHDVRFMTGDPAQVTERLVWCTYEDEDGHCGHTCKEGIGCE